MFLLAAATDVIHSGMPPLSSLQRPEDHKQPLNTPTVFWGDYNGERVRARNQSRHISRNGRNNMGDCAMKISPAILNFGKPPSCIDLVSMRFEEATAGMIPTAEFERLSKIASQDQEKVPRSACA